MIRRSTTAALCALTLFSPCAVPAAAGPGAAIFTVNADGMLTPVAVRLRGTFLPPGSNEGGPPDRLRAEALASLATGGRRVHVVFGARTVATVPAKVANGAATIGLPPALHLGGYVMALASPTLAGHPGAGRRAPTAAERRAALALAAKAVGAAGPAALTVRNLTAIDLGHGMAVVGTVSRRGSGPQPLDRRLFFVAEPNGGALRMTLANPLTIRVTEPLLEQTGEALIDAIDLGDGSLSLVTTQVGFDASTYAIYSRRGAGWKSVYTGGGAGL